MLRIKVTSDIGQAIDRLSRIPGDLSRGLIDGIRTEAIRLQRHIVADYLSGQALHRISGRLSRSIRSNINEEFIYDGGRVVGMNTIVGTNVEYAAYHECGFKGVEQVRAHVRRIKSRSVFGRERRTSKKTGKEYNAKVKLSQGVAYVRAHTRTVNYQGHPFMRPALEDLTPTIRENIRALVERACGGGS